ncbi:MAG TPA: hypothetical protein PL045_00565 [Chitinophagaceae bacterium]|nr:hypothetical protein [Chitinophagaceae bacterium]
MIVKIGVTGHRKLEDALYAESEIGKIIAAQIAGRNDVQIEGYSSLAAGADTIFAKKILEAGGNLKIVLPFAKDEYEKDFSKEEIKVFEELLEHDANPEVMSEIIPANKDERNACYLAAGKTIVDKCDVMIAVWDGEKAEGKGGTGDIADYASAKGKKFIHIKTYRSDISRLFTERDKKAITLKELYSLLWKISILFSLTAAIFLAVSQSFFNPPEKYIEENKFFASAELFFAIAALAIIIYLKLTRLNQRRLNMRREAERLRQLEKFYNAGLNIKPLEKFEGISQELVDMENKYSSIEDETGNFESGKEQLLELIISQIKYHEEKRPEFKNESFIIFLEKLKFPLLIIFILGVLIHSYTAWFADINNDFSHDEFLHLLHQFGLLFSLITPPSYAAIEGYIYFTEYHKILSDSHTMQAFFERKQKEIMKLDDKSSDSKDDLHDIALEIREKMDDETKDWYVVMQPKDMPGLT